MALNRVQVLLNDEQLEYLDSIAKETQRSRSEVSRLLISAVKASGNGFEKAMAVCNP